MTGAAKNKMDLFRMRYMAVALMRFDLRMADFVCWLGGEYRHPFLDIGRIKRVLSEVVDDDPWSSVHSRLNLPDELRVYREGTPLQGHFKFRRDDVYRHNTYNNHRPAHENSAKIISRLWEEEQKIFHLVVPHWMWHFIEGIHLLTTNMVCCKNKYRQVVDPKARLFPTDTGAVNDQIKNNVILSKCPQYFYPMHWFAALFISGTR